MKAFLLFLSLSGPYQDECANLVGSCDYYACIDEHRLPCGDEGYPLGYGKKYCEKFSAMNFTDARTSFTADVYPAHGNEWRDNVRTCLQVSLEQWFAEDSAKDCSTLRTVAFNSHPACYTGSPSFCDLTPENVVRVGLTVELNDLFKADSQRQIRDTSRLCVTQLDERIAGEDRLLVKLKLIEYKKLWSLAAYNPTLFHSLFSTQR